MESQQNRHMYASTELIPKHSYNVHVYAVIHFLLGSWFCVNDTEFDNLCADIQGRSTVSLGEMSSQGWLITRRQIQRLANPVMVQSSQRGNGCRTRETSTPIGSMPSSYQTRSIRLVFPTCTSVMFTPCIVYERKLVWRCITSTNYAMIITALMCTCKQSLGCSCWKCYSKLP